MDSNAFILVAIAAVVGGIVGAGLTWAVLNAAPPGIEATQDVAVVDAEGRILARLRPTEEGAVLLQVMDQEFRPRALFGVDDAGAPLIELRTAEGDVEWSAGSGAAPDLERAYN
jgi:hypothetical protein